MPHLFNIQRLRVAAEATGVANFGQELSGSIGSFVDVRCNSGEAQLMEEILPDEAKVQRTFQRRLGVVGARNGTLNLGLDLVSGDVLDSAASPPATPDWGLGLICNQMWGGYSVAAGSAEAGASTASVLNVTGGHGSRWASGDALLVDVGGKLEAREVDTPSTDALTPKVQFSGAPTGSTPVYNSHSFFMGDDPNESMQFVWETDERDAIYWMLGAQMQSVGLELNLRQLARATLGLQFATWLQDDSVGTPLGGSAIAEGDLTDGGDPLVFVDSHVHFGPLSTFPMSPTEIDPTELTVTMNHSFAAVPSPRGVEGVLRWFIRPPDPGTPLAQLQFTVPLESGNWKTYEAAKAAQTKYYFFAQVGAVAGKTFLLAMNTLQIVDVQPGQTGDGLHGVTVMANVLEDDAGITDAQTRSPVRWHFL